jgi:hypothetical protein
VSTRSILGGFNPSHDDGLQKTDQVHGIHRTTKPSSAIESRICAGNLSDAGHKQPSACKKQGSNATAEQGHPRPE